MTHIGRRSTPLARVGYTPSQQWAKQNAACIAGRRRLGKLSVYVYFQQTCHIDDLQWIAGHLKPADPTAEIAYNRERYQAGAWAKGAWRYPSRMRKALIAIMSSFDVQWPTEIL